MAGEAFAQTVEDFGGATTIHGLAYVLPRSQYLVDR